MKIDNERQYFIKELFRQWNSGNRSLSQLSNKMYDLGLRSSGGKKVGKSAIENMLKDIIYAGGLTYDGQTNENAQHEAIISLEEYFRAQRVFTIRNKGADRSRKHFTLLAGLAHCFACGELMYGEYHSDGNYYRCKKCKKTYANMGLVDKSIEKFFAGAIFTEKGLSGLRSALLSVKLDQGTGLPNQKQSLENRKKALEDKMSKLEDALLYGDASVDKARIKSKYEPLKLELKATENQLKELSKPSYNLKDSEIEKVVEGMKRVKELYGAFEPLQKRQFLRFFITKVFVDAGANKAVQYELVPEFENLIKGDLVRITSNWLPRVDSNH